MKKSLLLIALLGSYALHAEAIYLNTLNDTGGTVVYSTGPYTQVGDQITLGGTSRVATTATAQFYNAGSAGGTFDALLRIFNIGAPVGSQVGATFTTAGNSIGLGGILNVSFNLGGLTVPNNLIFTLALANASAGLDLGVTVFDPPTVGSSSNTFFIVNNGSTFSQASQGGGQDNLFFSLSTAAVPEPGTLSLFLLAVPALAGLRRYLRG